MTTLGTHAVPCAVADPGSVEARFGARNCRPGGCDFDPAPWVLDEHNRIPAGALMVLADHILGEPAFMVRPAGWWTLTTEVTLDIVGDLPARGALSGEARLVRHEHHAAFAECAITDATGKVQAVGTAQHAPSPWPPTDTSRAPTLPGTRSMCRRAPWMTFSDCNTR
ncbi:hypothetical protein H7J93_18880 [Mycobacterium barrassiae]|uniref:hypothetical protein n=1 Tax=Mycobacterium barrassiae TaxID=319709 RepID=UPI002265B3FD|nr:hypothetical protein [Mycobacterium barrassiae]MCV7301690.1 hypothetical protein [Mycobacterium barrassiae]